MSRVCLVSPLQGHVSPGYRQPAGGDGAAVLHSAGRKRLRLYTSLSFFIPNNIGWLCLVVTLTRRFLSPLRTRSTAWSRGTPSTSLWWRRSRSCGRRTASWRPTTDVLMGHIRAGAAALLLLLSYCISSSPSHPDSVDDDRGAASLTVLERRFNTSGASWCCRHLRPLELCDCVCKDWSTRVFQCLNRNCHVNETWPQRKIVPLFCCFQCDSFTASSPSSSVQASLMVFKDQKYFWKNSINHDSLKMPPERESNYSVTRPLVVFLSASTH